MASVFTFSPDLERYKKSGAVALGAMLQSVVLLKVSASRQPEDAFKDSENTCKMQFRHRMASSRFLDEGVLAVEIEGLLEFLQPQVSPDEKEKLLGSIAATFEVRYRFPEGPLPEGVKESFPDFGEINGLYNAWPYLRAKIQEISSDMGMPVVLPTLRISPRKAEQKVADGTKSMPAPKPKSRVSGSGPKF